MPERREVSVDTELERTGYQVTTRKSRGFFPTWHSHEGLELVVVHSGTVEFHYEDSCQVLSPGDAFLINGSKLHTPRVVSGRLDRTVFHFRPELAACAPAPGGRILPYVKEQGIGFRFSLPVDARHRLRWVAEQLHALSRRPASRTLVEALMGLVVAEVETAAMQKRPARPPILDAVVDYMAGNAASTETLEELAARFSVSPRYLAYLFKEHLRCSPRQYWLDLKMKQARALLSNTTLTVDRVAQAVGFASARGFEVAFRRVTGLSPAEYRLRRSGRSLGRL